MTRDPYIPTPDDLIGADLVLSQAPRTRADCPPASVPCPYVTCRMHAWTDTSRSGAIRESAAWGDLAHTCILREVEAHPDGMSLEQVGEILGVSREYIRQIEEGALARASKSRDLRGYLDDLEEEG